MSAASLFEVGIPKQLPILNLVTQPRHLEINRMYMVLLSCVKKTDISGSREIVKVHPVGAYFCVP